MNFLVIQHLDIEPPALIAEILEHAGHRLVTVHPDQGETIPDASAFDGVIIMGGPQSANDKKDYILDELIWLKDMIKKEIPMLGICLGAQLMAKACGAEIFPSPVRELGWFPVYHSDKTANDPLFRCMPNGLLVFQWHGETFSFNNAMTRVATQPDVPAQAFRLGKNQYGLQFHIEINESIIETWIAYGQSEREYLGEEGIRQIKTDTSMHLKAMRNFCKQLLHAWLTEIRL